MFNPTPGPWKLVNRVQVASRTDDRVIAEAGRNDDAQLIAVAPMILNMLSNICDDSVRLNMTENDWAMARTVLAKIKKGQD